jgi:peptidoglycan/LPS O-acetylase OafA/YrhL
MRGPCHDPARKRAGAVGHAALRFRFGGGTAGRQSGRSGRRRRQFPAFRRAPSGPTNDTSPIPPSRMGAAMIADGGPACDRRRLKAIALMHTLQSQLNMAHNRPTGFDYLRLTLALSIVVWHSVTICYGPAAEAYFWTGPPRPVIALLLPSFFALSGFLVAGSLERNNVPEFLTLRVTRIFPALAVEVLISAIIIGPLLTTVAWREYFSSYEFFSYFLNLFGNIHYLLPGVFVDNPTPKYVNAQLWTVPVELYCYLIITGSSMLGVIKIKNGLFVGTLCIVMLLTFSAQFGLTKLPPFSPDVGFLTISFLFGVSLYIMRCQITYSRFLFSISLSLYVVLCMNRNFIYLSALPLTYAIIFIGLQNPPKITLIRGVDYSYGIYLYGFPLQQTVCYLFPSHRFWYVNALSGVALALVLAYLSWTFVESRVVSHRKICVSFVSSQVERLKTGWRQCLRFKFSARRSLLSNS